MQSHSLFRYQLPSKPQLHKTFFILFTGNDTQKKKQGHTLMSFLYQVFSSRCQIHVQVKLLCRPTLNSLSALVINLLPDPGYYQHKTPGLTMEITPSANRQRRRAKKWRGKKINLLTGKIYTISIFIHPL
jgi:hypothetical protein